MEGYLGLSKNCSYKMLSQKMLNASNMKFLLLMHKISQSEAKGDSRMERRTSLKSSLLNIRALTWAVRG